MRERKDNEFVKPLKDTRNNKQELRTNGLEIQIHLFSLVKFLQFLYSCVITFPYLLCHS